MDRPTALEDTTVVEVTGSYAGAGCGRLLAELGADVILVEPSGGHPLRDAVDGDAADHYFETVAVGKRSVAVDDPETSPAFDDLLAAADVLVTDGRSPLDVSEERATAANPGLIYCSITPFGDEGPRSGRTGNGPVVEAATGLTATSGFPDGPPAATAVPVAAAVGAIVGCGSVLAQLYAGSDAPIDVSMGDAVLPFLRTFLPEYFATGEPVGRSGNRHPLAAPWNAYRAEDGWVYFIAWTDRYWEEFLAMAGREDLVDDPRFGSVGDRRGNVEAVDDVVREWIEGRTVEEVLELADEHDLTAAPIRDVHGAYGDPNLEHRGMVVRSNGHLVAGSPFAMSETPGRIPSPAPGVGEDTDDWGEEP